MKNIVTAFAMKDALKKKRIKKHKDHARQSSIKEFKEKKKK